MTLEELSKLDRPYVTVQDIGAVIGVRADTLRWQARTDPSRLGFPVCVAGDTVRIPRLAFIAWVRGNERIG